MTRSPGRRRSAGGRSPPRDRKSTRLNSSHGYISYAVFCLQKKKGWRLLCRVNHNFGLAGTGMHVEDARATSRPSLFFLFNDTATTEIYTLSLHDALPTLGRSPP